MPRTVAIPADYVPGACNIGRAEIRRRRRGGVLLLAVTLAAWVWLVAADAAPGWFLALAVPASLSAVGFLQAAFRFCVHYGLLSLMGFGAVGATVAVEDEEARRADRASSWRILAMSVLAGGLLALVAYTAAV